MRLSIITVTLNNLKGLIKTTNSIIQQSWTDFEWLVIDGCSSDGTQEYLQSLSHKPDWYVSEHDTGVYNAMNKGIAHAKGEYVIFMNAGDSFHSKDTLAQVFSYDLSSDVSYGDWIRVYSDRKEFCKAPSTMPPLYFFWANICQQAMFVNTKSLRESGCFDERYMVIGDWAKWRNFMLEGRSFSHIPVTVCNFEAETGLSEKHTDFADKEHEMLTNDFPIGLTRQGKILQQQHEFIQSLQGLDKNYLVRLVCYFHRKKAIWKNQGAKQTWKNFCITISNLFLRRS